MDTRPWWRVYFIAHVPVITTVLIEVGNISQILRMWRERSAAGQSLLGWLALTLGMALWAIWYRIEVPDKPVPMYMALVGLAVNLAIAITVLYFRYYA